MRCFVAQFSVSSGPPLKVFRRTSTSTIYIIRIYCSVGNGVIEIKRSPAAVSVSAATKRVPETFDLFDLSSEKALQIREGSLKKKKTNEQTNEQTNERTNERKNFIASYK